MTPLAMKRCGRTIAVFLVVGLSTVVLMAFGDEIVPTQRRNPVGLVIAWARDGTQVHTFVSTASPAFAFVLVNAAERGATPARLEGRMTMNGVIPVVLPASVLGRSSDLSDGVYRVTGRGFPLPCMFRLEPISDADLSATSSGPAPLQDMIDRIAVTEEALIAGTGTAAAWQSAMNVADTTLSAAFDFRSGVPSNPDGSDSPTSVQPVKCGISVPGYWALTADLLVCGVVASSALALARSGWRALTGQRSTV